MKPADVPEFPVGEAFPEVVVVSHAHLDHSGVVPNLMRSSPSVYMTPVTRELLYILCKDTLKLGKEQGICVFDKRDLNDLMNYAFMMPYRERFWSSGYEFELYDAGHIPGSASVHVRSERDDLNLFYTGDIKLEDTRLLKGADINPPETDVLIIESTYFGEKHPDRRELEERFVASVEETLDAGGNAIVPCFAVGRTQEMVMILHAHGITPYVDGMGLSVLRKIKKHLSFMRDGEALVEAFKDARFVTPKSRKKVLSEPSVVVTTAGMLNGGPALYYLERIKDDPRSKILLTGYQIEGTNGRRLLEEGVIELNGGTVKVKAQVEQYDFSAHADDSDLKMLIERFCERGVEYVFTVHGENAAAFAAWIRENFDCQSFAPNLGESFVI
ncbi:MAG: RNA processing exonuclease [Candidatus Alkanophagales archaeon MCA70_species_2]|nr:RNA processing exonuclease [Candidatus Alkanophaga liquidiphilum]